MLFLFLFRRAQGGAGQGAFSFGKSRAKRVSPDAPKVSFKDVAGADEAVEELQEIKEFLAEPAKFRALGARIPKGVLLAGPPGTGKTLLARAVAGEAGVPFFSISGSDFVEMFVGVGASRVRDLFNQAKAVAPAIVFIDEIDAVGRHRGAGLRRRSRRARADAQPDARRDGRLRGEGRRSSSSRPRTARTCSTPRCCARAASTAHVIVDRPDVQGARAILEVHTKGEAARPAVDLDALAAGRPGFTGADLANLVNEAALLAARRGRKAIGPSELDESVIRVDRGTGEEDAPPLGAGAEDHRLSRDGPRARRPLSAATPTRSTRFPSSAAAGRSA